MQSEENLNNRKDSALETCETTEITSKQVSFHSIEKDDSKTHLFTIYHSDIIKEILDRKDELFIDSENFEPENDKIDMKILSIEQGKIKFIIDYYKKSKYFKNKIYDERIVKILIFNLINSGIEYKANDIFNFSLIYFERKEDALQNIHADISSDYTVLTYFVSSRTTELLLNFTLPAEREELTEEEKNEKCPLLRFINKDEYLTLAFNNTVLMHRAPSNIVPNKVYSHDLQRTIEGIDYIVHANNNKTIQLTGKNRIALVIDIKKEIYITEFKKSDYFSISEFNYNISDFKVNFNDTQEESIKNNNNEEIGHRKGDYYYVKRQHLNNYVLELENLNGFEVGGNKNKKRKIRKEKTKRKRTKKTEKKRQNKKQPYRLTWRR